MTALTALLTIGALAARSGVRRTGRGRPQDNHLWSFQKRDLRESERIETSSMPSYAGTLSDDELTDLVAFLYGLIREEG